MQHFIRVYSTCCDKKTVAQDPHCFPYKSFHNNQLINGTGFSSILYLSSMFKAAKSVTSDLIFLVIMFLIFKNTVI